MDGELLVFCLKESKIRLSFDWVGLSSLKNLPEFKKACNPTHASQRTVYSEKSERRIEIDWRIHGTPIRGSTFVLSPQLPSGRNREFLDSQAKLKFDNLYGLIQTKM